VPPIDPSIIFGALQLLGTIGGAALAVKLQMARLSDGQTEVLRQLGALHKRMDHHGNEVVRIDKELVRVDERVKGMKDSQRFRLKSQAEQDMFVVGDE
jgi:hypothetical protein